MLHDTHARSTGVLGPIAVALVLLLLLAAGLWAVLDALDQPEVRVSYASGLCVEVKDHRAEHEGKPSRWSCSRLPPRYERVWVE